MFVSIISSSGGDASLELLAAGFPPMFLVADAPYSLTPYYVDIRQDSIVAGCASRVLPYKHSQAAYGFTLLTIVGY